MAKGPVSPELLHRAWLHSHEEDSKGRMVFRPSTYAFPPSRGRTGFDLRPDGTLLETGIGPTDRRTQSAGKWTLEGSTLRLHDRGERSEQALSIAELGPDRLVVHSKAE
jgi:hypothetical protein